LIRAKFRLAEVRSSQYQKEYEPVKTLIFETQYDQTIPEDVRFTIATPTGRMEMRVDNPNALSYFEVGKYYYLDMTKIEGK
jgi:hypothetical protein